jgi:hypothetical protein
MSEANSPYWPLPWAAQRKARGPEASRARVLGVLRDRDRWPLAFDNAESPEGIAGWLPGGAGTC